MVECLIHLRPRSQVWYAYIDAAPIEMLYLTCIDLLRVKSENVKFYSELGIYLSKTCYNYYNWICFATTNYLWWIVLGNDSNFRKLLDCATKSIFNQTAIKNVSLRFEDRRRWKSSNSPYSDLTATCDTIIAPFSRAGDASGVECSGSKVRLIIVRKMKTIVGSAENWNTTRIRNDHGKRACVYVTAWYVRENTCMKMRAWKCVRARSRTLLLRAFAVIVAQSGSGDGDGVGGKSERLQCWDHVIAMASKEWSWDLRLSEYTADERERRREVRKKEIKILWEERSKFVRTKDSRGWRFIKTGKDPETGMQAESMEKEG